MRIITLTCERCETIVAANELERHRVFKCPGLGCEEILAFDDLPEEDQRYFLENRARYRL